MNTMETESIRHQAKIAALPLVENRATAETAQTLRDELLYHRATQTYLWALPLINTLGMQRRLREDVRRGVQRLAGVEEAPRRQDARDHAELGRDLCDELRRSRQGRPARVRRPADAPGHPVGFLATADPRRWRQVRRRLRLLRPGSGEGRQVPAPAAGLRGRSPGGLLRLPLGHEQRVRVPPGLLCRCEQPEAAGRADREDEDLPAEGRGQTDEVPGCLGRTGEHAPDQRRDGLRRN